MKIKKLRNFLLGLCMVVLWLAVFVKAGIVWAEHPAEQPITEAAYMEMIGGYGR